MSKVVNQSILEFNDNFDFNIIFEISNNNRKHTKGGGHVKSLHESFDSTFKDLNTTVVGDAEQKSKGVLLEEGLDVEKVRDASMETEVNRPLSQTKVNQSLFLNSIS